ncbi:MAG TPA: histidinol dehydrogenase [Acidimicrobiales bacterium]|jgi:histidinol dehydrogenase|nr:histidinol dehydrogenase [Acidimicrobiales bacterium]
MGLRRVDLRGLDGRLRLHEALAHPVGDQDRSPGPVQEPVEDVLAEVRQDGDSALRRLTQRFDGVAVDELRVAPTAVTAALDRIPDALRDALEVAHERILAYHAHESGGKEPDDFESGGITVRHLRRPVERAGCYAPGGRARYPSTVLMCAVPARVAGVDRIVLCVPPAADGHIDDASLAAAALAGVDEVYRVGGAQAIAAMAFGTESIEPVDVIVGPGNRFVAEAKRQVSGLVGVPSAFAGPSEVVVVAGPGTPPEFAAIDLVVQAEHGPDGAAWLVTWSEEVADAVEHDVERLVRRSPRRADLEATLGTGGHVVMVEGPEQACAVANIVAPEHLELLTDDADTLLPLIDAAGAVFLGPMSPASVGDYLAGPNHILPTNRSARFSSALRVDDFWRHIHAVTVTESALETLGPAVVTLAEAEGLHAHAESVRVRWPG